MPLTVEEVKEMPEEMLKSSQGTVKSYVLNFLRDNKDNAYTPKEIKGGVIGKPLRRGKIGKAAVSGALTSLIQSKAIKRKGIYYWYESQ